MVDKGALRLLFYGGCHAAVLRRIFLEFAEVNLQSDVIINFQLIPSGKPFPIWNLHNYDVVIFSPILNKEKYNTIHLLEECKRLRIKTVVYPWLQWNGYFPFAKKGRFCAAEAWYYGAIPGLDGVRNQEEFRVLLDDAFSDTEAIETHLSTTSARLKSGEVEGKCDVKIHEFVMDSYQSSRLFLTPDHPSKLLYNFVVHAISELTSIPISPSFYWSQEEPQYGVRLPIDPRVSDVLGLHFFDADYQNFNSPLGERYVHYREYNRILFGEVRGLNILRSCAGTYVKSGPVLASHLSDDEKLFIPAGSIIQLEILGSEENHHACVINWAGNKYREFLPSSLFQKCYLFAPHWERL